MLCPGVGCQHARQSHERQGNSSANTVSFGWREDRKAKLLELTRVTTYTAANNAYSMNNLIACGYKTYAPPRS
jgi:hypothetical protein